MSYDDTPVFSPGYSFYTPGAIWYLKRDSWNPLISLDPEYVVITEARVGTFSYMICDQDGVPTSGRVVDNGSYALLQSRWEPLKIISLSDTEKIYVGV